MNIPTTEDSLQNWLDWLEALHPSAIEMGLDRVGRVADRARLRPAQMPVVLIGGTNGKGSTVTLLAQIYSNAGHRVGAYMSPHIDVFNERMRVNGHMLQDQKIVNALFEIEQHRGDDTLTYFEYTTLAAMSAFNRAGCDVVLLEVGLGGRLDATNLWDCDCAILTSIALDHQSYLGDTREAVAFEKIAIGRRGQPMIVGETNPPANLAQIANDAGMQLQFIDPLQLPDCALAGEHQQRNAACALLAVEALQARLPVAQDHIDAGLASVFIAGRFEQLIVEGVNVVLDVAHNPAAAFTVCETLRTVNPDAQVHCVFAALNDKDIDGVVNALLPMVDHWYCTSLDVSRATPVDDLCDQVKAIELRSGNRKSVRAFHEVGLAWHAALTTAQNDAQTRASRHVILVAGSFFTLSELRAYWQANCVHVLPATRSSAA